MAMAGTVKFFNASVATASSSRMTGTRCVRTHHRRRAGRAQTAQRGTAHLFDVEPDKKGKGPKAVNLVITG